MVEKARLGFLLPTTAGFGADHKTGMGHAVPDEVDNVREGPVIQWSRVGRRQDVDGIWPGSVLGFGGGSCRHEEILDGVLHGGLMKGRSERMMRT